MKLAHRAVGSPFVAGPAKGKDVRTDEHRRPGLEAVRVLDPSLSDCAAMAPPR